MTSPKAEAPKQRESFADEILVFDAARLDAGPGHYGFPHGIIDLGLICSLLNKRIGDYR